MVELLLNKGAAVEARNSAGRTALLAAAAEDDVRTVPLLLDRGAAPGVCDHDGNTALHLDAPRALSTQVAKALLRAGTDPSAVNGQGRTPLMLAAMAARKDLVSLLLASGADPGIRDRSGVGALDLARKARAVPDLAPADADDLDRIIGLLNSPGRPR